ncbi:Ragulator complex protein LAMTOR2, partial [Trichinella sp. T6]
LIWIEVTNARGNGIPSVRRYSSSLNSAEAMIRPTVLNSILCQANAEGVTGTLLMNREGMVLCHAGCDESRAEAIAAIASNIWCSYEKSGQETFRDDKLKWFFLEGSEGRIAICKVATLLLCMVANDTVETGMLRSKLHAVKHCLEPSLTHILPR